MSFLRFLMLLSLIVWIGGIIFFAFVLAPTLFHVLPTTKLAGDIVNATLGKLHWMGLFSGVAFLAASLLYNWQMHGQLKPFALSHILIVLMLALTAFSQFHITPRMRQLRTEMASATAWHDSDEIEFQALHKLSTWTEGTVLIFGLIIVVSTSRRFGNSN